MSVHPAPGRDPAAPRLDGGRAQEVAVLYR
jgi:hypothetical protein